MALPTAPASPTSPAMRWTGRIFSGLVIVFLLFDGIIKLVPLPEVTDTLAQLGYPSSPGFARGLGLLTLACIVLYAIPRTAMLGAILLTGLFGGAMAAHVRVGSPLFSHVLFGAYLGLLTWAGLALRDRRLPALLRGDRSTS